MSNLDTKLNIEWMDIGTVRGYEQNAKKHPPKQIEQIANSLKEFGFLQPLVVDDQNVLVVGHGRLLGAQKLGLAQIPVMRAAHLTPQQIAAYRLADNKLNESEWNLKLAYLELQKLDLGGYDITLTGFDKKFVLDFGYNKAKLADLFLVPPFSVLDTRLKEWLNRRKVWKAVINDSGESREHTLSGADSVVSDINNGVSLLDPVLAEVLCRWFGKKGFAAFDPFAGDTVFGYVAGTVGLNFTGIELRPEQVALNQKRCDEDKLPCKYICDDAQNMDAHIADESQDFIFSCPPYADLEHYSDDPRDLSNMGTEDFFKLLTSVLAKTYKKLKPNRFAAIVVSEVRGKDGNFIGLVPKTIAAMEGAGYHFYNEAILVNAIGTLPMRAGRVMNLSRKLGRMHQNVLIFFKGDPATIKDTYGALTKDENG